MMYAQFGSSVSKVSVASDVRYTSCFGTMDEGGGDGCDDVETVCLS